MRSINKVILVGNLTRTPELRQTPNGQSVCTFGMATNRQWMARDSQKHSLAEFHNIVAWSKLAEFCANNLQKGKLVYVEGYLKTKTWELNGVKKYRTEIVINDMCMLDKRPKDHEYLPEDTNDSYSNDEGREDKEKQTTTTNKRFETSTEKNNTPKEVSGNLEIDLDSDLNL